MDPSLRPGQIIDLIAHSGIDATHLIFELSERDVVDDIAVLIEPLRYLRALGAKIALDDFGSGHSNFSLWQALGPEYVKLDRGIVHGLSQSSRQLAIVRALIQVAEEFGTDLVAEGIEELTDLALLRDLGIRCGQGYALARPASQPVVAVPEALNRMNRWPVPLRPTSSPAIVAREIIAGHLLIEAPSVSIDASNSRISELFKQHPQLHALAVIDDGIPVGLINRRIFMERYGQPFFRELFGAKSCIEFMHGEPVICEADTPVSALLDVLRSARASHWCVESAKSASKPHAMPIH